MQKTIDYVADALRLLNSLLAGYHSQDAKMEPISIALNDIIDSDGDLHVLQGLVDAFVYKEEIKPPKVSKKKNAEPPPPPPPENSLIIEMRRLGLRALYYFTLPQVNGAVEADKLQSTFIHLPLLFERVCDTADAVFENLALLPPVSEESPITAEGVILMQDGLYVLRVMTFIMMYDKHAASKLAARASVLAKFPALLQHALLRLMLLQVLHSLSLCEEGLDALVLGGLMSELVSHLELANKSLLDMTAPPEPAATGKGAPAVKAPPKKDDKGKKGVVVVEEVEDPMTKLDYMRLDAKRTLVAVITIIIKTLIKLSSKRSNQFAAEHAKRVTLVLQKVMLCEDVWVEVKTLTQPVDEDIRRALELCCTLIGCMGEISHEVREEVSRCGIILVLMQLVMCAKKACAATRSPSTEPPVDPPYPRAVHAVSFIERDDAELLEATLSLRRYAEKAVFALIADEKVDTDVDPATLQQRWATCNSYSVTTERVVEYGTTFLNLLNDMFDGNDAPTPLEPPPSEKDIKGKKGAAAPPPVEAPKDMSFMELDMGARGVRILAAVLLSLSDTEAFLTQTNADKVLLPKLSSYVQRALVYGMDKAEDVLGSIGSNLDQNVESALYLASSVLERFLPRSADNIKVFVNKERIEIYSRVLVRSGPCNDRVDVPECTISMVDLRDYDWDLVPKSESVLGYNNLLRPLVLDVFSILAQADQRYREYDNTVSFPLESCIPLPKSTCSCEDCSLLSIKTVADVVARIMLLPTQFSVYNETQIQVNLAPANVDLNVRNAALRLLVSIGQSNSIGMMACIEGLASKGFGPTWHDSSAINLGQLLVDYSSSMGQTFDLGVVPWQRPQFFSDILPKSGVFVTSPGALIENSVILPFVLLVSTLLTVLIDPLSTPESCLLALIGLKKFSSCSAHFSSANQPVLYDAFCTVFLALGGAVSLASILGRYGQIDTKSKAEYVDLLTYLTSRGTVREKYWYDWMVAHKEEVVLDPKTGKPIVKKDDKKRDAKDTKKVDPKAPPTIPSLISDIVLNVESTEEIPDPNRGPNKLYWKTLLDSYHSSYRLHTSQINLLIACTQSHLSDIVQHVLNQDAEVNGHDDEGRSALVYALVLNDSVVIDSLLAHASIDVDKVDGYGVPIINYVFYTISGDMIDQYLPGPYPLEDQAHVIIKPELCHSAVSTLGCNDILQKLLEHGKVDVNVCDAEGNSPLHLAVGLGSVVVFVGGYQFNIRPIAYHSAEYALGNTHRNVQALLNFGMSVNACNREGMVALHVASAWGDFTLVQLLVNQQALINALDVEGRHALHYLLACCPEKTQEIFDFIFGKAIFKPLDQMVFSDDRTGKPETEKSTNQLDKFVNSVLRDNLEPEILSKQRLLHRDVLTLTCMKEKFSLLFILMIAADLRDKIIFLSEAIVGDKIFRLHMALYLLNQAKEQDCIHSACEHITRSNMSILHALTILCKGETAKVDLTDKQKRNKRVKSYQSIELNVTDEVLNFTKNIDFYTSCSTAVAGLLCWMPLEMAIRNNNSELVKLILNSSSAEQLTSCLPVHFMARIQNAFVDRAVSQAVIDRCKDVDDSRLLLNGEIKDDSSQLHGTPMHFAVLNRQQEVVSALCSSNKVDVNCKHPTMQHTALTLACYLLDESLIRAFQPAKDRLDFAISSHSLGFEELTLLSETLDESNLLYTHRFVPTNTVTCVDVIMHARNLNMLKVLADMRKNDVIEQLIAEKEYPNEQTNSWLLVLEKENNEIVSQLEQDSRQKEMLMTQQQERDVQLASEHIVAEIVSEEEQDKEGLSAAQEREDTEQQELEENQDNMLDVTQEFVTFTIQTSPEVGDEEEGHQSPRSLEQETPNLSVPATTDLILDGFAPLSSEERQVLVNKLQQSNAIVSYVVDLVNSSGIVTEEYHLSDKYYNNELANISM
ncbi:hypothetical protein EON65_12365 [archaeon]|nr:MAG: hypothetical protein EON65_12365 [archaeon]